MNYAELHRNNQTKDKRRSAVITALLTLLFFLLIYFYQFTRTLPKEEVITTMLINFGDNQNGTGEEEPAPQTPPNTVENIQPHPTPVSPPQPETKPHPQETVKDKILTGKNEKLIAEKPKETKKEAKSKEKTTNQKTDKAPSSQSKTRETSSATANSQPQPNEAVGNLLRGRGSKAGSQGSAGTSGNEGDPLGGEGSGNSKIGVDRKLVAFIPGTMGRGGAQPAHDCTASGTITISYTVDKAGNVTSAHRLSGSSDPCIVSTTISWIKRYVKAEKAQTSSTGTYSISF